jgi:hypothetical protein
MSTGARGVGRIARAWAARLALASVALSVALGCGAEEGSPAGLGVAAVQQPLPNGTACASAADCDSGYCPATPTPSVCAACTQDHHCATTQWCNAGVCTARLANGANCGAAANDNRCQINSFCRGSTLLCTSCTGFNGAACDDGNPCRTGGTCNAGACVGSGNAAVGTDCNPDGNACTLDQCNGTGTCIHTAPGNTGARCRLSAGVCDVEETCTGAATACPTDAFVAGGTSCADDGDACTDDHCPGNAAACSHPTAASCSNGLTVTYYDNHPGFYGTAVTRIDPVVDFAWGNGSPATGIGADTFSARWTGQVLADFTETYTFETETDDGVRLWVNDVLLVNRWVDQGPTAYSGTIALVAGTRYDIKMDYYEAGGGAEARLRWSSPSVPLAIIPNDHLFASGDQGTGGMAWDDGANAGTGDPYQVWQVSTTPGVAPVNVTSASPNNWGLGDAVMMVPAFSPDGTKLAFIDGDDAGGAGWRKGLSVWDFDASAQLFSNRQSIVNNWPDGDVLKWPVWESDSRSVIYQTSTPTEICTQCDGKTGYRYGNMAPTNYYGVQGRLWSVDTAGGAPVLLANLNTGERPDDANKAYQPTTLPVAAGGYRWVVFTSTRPYGNRLNDPGTSVSCLSSQLWVSAVDDTVSAGADRSHPAFWLPNQRLGTPDAPSYINERGYWALDPCKPTGTGPESECESSDDCCGAPTTAACRIDQPATVPPTRHCVAVNSAVCSADGASCSVDADCCGAPSSLCLSGACTPPPPVPAFQDGSFFRDYEGVCPPDEEPVWRFFDWQASTPGDSEIVFSAQTAHEAAALGSAPSTVFGTASGPTIPGWVGEDVGAALSADGRRSQRFLRVTMSLNASTDRLSAPTLTDWRQAYSCIAAR